MKISDISDNFSFNNGCLTISKVDVTPIVKSVGSPLYIYDMDTISDRYNYLRSNLPKEVDIFYAMKANSNIAVVKHLVNLGAGVEVASEGELYACKKIGVNPKNIIFAGPSKTDRDLEMAIDMGIYALNAESLGEVIRINKIAASKNVVMDVELRVNPEFEISGVAVSLGGGSKKFGIDTEQVPGAIERIKELKNVRLQGIHVFAGTGIDNTEGFLSNFENCVKLADEINRNNFKVLSIDIGGGIGIPYSDSDTPLNIEGINSYVTDLISKYPFIRDNGVRIIAEPGRYLVGESGVYITRIEDLKHSRGRDYILVDGGAQHLLRPALLEQPHPTFNISRGSGDHITEDNKSFDVGGSLCTSIDFIGKGLPLPKDSSIGDYIGVFCSGAYGYNESMPFFLSHDFAAEVLIHNGKWDLIREGYKMAEFVDRQIVPEELG